MDLGCWEIQVRSNMDEKMQPQQQQQQQQAVTLQTIREEDPSSRETGPVNEDSRDTAQAHEDSRREIGPFENSRDAAQPHEDSCRETAQFENSRDTAQPHEDSGRETGQDSRDTAQPLKDSGRETGPEDSRDTAQPHEDSTKQTGPKQTVEQLEQLALTRSAARTKLALMKGKAANAATVQDAKPELGPDPKLLPTPVRNVQAQVDRDAEVAAMLSTFSDDDMGSQDENDTQLYSVSLDLDHSEPESIASDDEPMHLEDVASAEAGSKPALACQPGVADLQEAEQEVGRLLGRPVDWCPKASDFLSPDMQNYTNKKTSKKGSKAGKSKKTKKGKRPRGKCAKKVKGGKRARKAEASEAEASIEVVASKGRGGKRAKKVEASVVASKAKGSKRAKEVEASMEVVASKAEGSKCAKKAEASTSKRKRKPSPSTEKPSRSSPKPKAKAKSKVKAAAESPKAKASKSKAAGKSRDTYRSPCLDTSLYKAKMSRKSAAYHRAFKAGKGEGKSEEDCRDLARAVSWL